MIKYILMAIAGLAFTSCSVTQEYFVKVKTDTVISSFEKGKHYGVNLGVFYKESSLLNHNLIHRLEAINPGIMRIPGGSWSNELYWNGNRVRISEESYIKKTVWDKAIAAKRNPIKIAFDTTRFNNDKWNVDYSGYAPGFRIHDVSHHLSNFHGFTDVLFLHKYIQSYNAETMVTVNMGTGTVAMAVEWVRWARNRKYFSRPSFDVKYWEMGNELDGRWELGHFLEDGSEMTAETYVAKYKRFTKAMKKEDPSIKVGGSAASNMQLAFIEDLIKDKEAPVDFISFHAYPSKKDDSDFITMAQHADAINDAVEKIKKWLDLYRPQEKDRIEIALTEWNIKVKQDITTVDMTNALWSAVMLGEIAESGIDIAIQWDLFSTTETGGHGMFNPDDASMTPRSSYWATYLWRNYMGDKMLELNQNLPEYARVYASIDKDDVCLMIINGSKNETLNFSLQHPGNKNKMQAEVINFSKEQFVLDKKTLTPAKSKKPDRIQTQLRQSKPIRVNPYSISVIRYKL